MVVEEVKGLLPNGLDVKLLRIWVQSTRPTPRPRSRRSLRRALRRLNFNSPQEVSTVAVTPRMDKVSRCWYCTSRARAAAGACESGLITAHLEDDNSRPQARSNREARARASLRLAMFEPGVVHRHLSSQKANPSTPCRKTNDAQTWAIVAEIKGESGQPWATPRVGCIQQEFRAENPGTTCAQALEQLKKKGRGFKMYKHFKNLSMAQRVKELGHAATSCWTKTLLPWSIARRNCCRAWPTQVVGRPPASWWVFQLIHQLVSCLLTSFAPQRQMKGRMVMGRVLQQHSFASEPRSLGGCLHGARFAKGGPPHATIAEVMPAKPLLPRSRGLQLSFSLI